MRARLTRSVFAAAAAALVAACAAPPQSGGTSPLYLEKCSRSPACGQRVASSFPDTKVT